MYRYKGHNLYESITNNQIQIRSRHQRIIENAYCSYNHKLILICVLFYIHLYITSKRFLDKILIEINAALNSCPSHDLFLFQGENFLSEKLYDEILADGRIYLIPAISEDLYFLRFAICAERTTSDDVKFSFSVIKTCADRMLRIPFTKNGFIHKPLIDIDASPKRLHGSFESLHLDTDK